MREQLQNKIYYHFSTIYISSRCTKLLVCKGVANAVIDIFEGKKVMSGNSAPGRVFKSKIQEMERWAIIWARALRRMRNTARKRSERRLERGDGGRGSIHILGKLGAWELGTDGTERESQLEMRSPFSC